MSDAQSLSGPLAALRVLELADEKGQFCGKVFGDLGADVVKIEPPGGEPSRRIGPFLDDIPQPADGRKIGSRETIYRFSRDSPLEGDGLRTIGPCRERAGLYYGR